MIAFYYLCDCVNTAVRVWFSLQLADVIFEPRLTKRKIRLGYVFTIGFITLLQFANSYLSHNTFSNNMLIIMVFIIAVVNILLYECKMRHCFCLNILSWLALTFIDFFVQICAWLIFERVGIKVDSLISFSIQRGIYLVICALLLVPMGFSLRRCFAQRREDIFRFWKQSGFIVLFSLPCMIYFQRIYLRMGSQKLFYRWWLFFSSIALIFFGLEICMLKKRLKEEKRMYYMNAKMLEDGYQCVLKGYREKLVLMHDVKNHIRMLYTLLSEEPREECQLYITQLTSELQKNGNMVWTNHNVLDLLLNLKFQEADDAKIRVCCKSDDLRGLKLDSFEICALFANLIDNAVEANIRCPEEVEKKIELICRKQGNILAISISNPVGNDIKNPDLIFCQTTKQDKSSHGLGMISIKKVLDNHAGYMKVNLRNIWFNILIYLDGF